MVKDSLEPSGRSPNGLTATLDIRAGALAAKPAKTTRSASQSVGMERAQAKADASVKKEAPEADTQPETESVDQEDSSADVPADDVKEEAPAAPKASPFGKGKNEEVDDEETDEAPAKPVSGSSIFSKAS